MRFGIVLISLREMDGFGTLSGLRSSTEQLFMIKLFDNHCDLKKSVMRTWLVDGFPVVGKTVSGVLAYPSLVL